MIPHLKYPFSVSEPVYSPVVVVPAVPPEDDYETVLVDAGPWSYWRMGSGGLTDLSGNGRDAAANGGVTIGGVAGALAGDADAATAFDGTNDYAELSTGATFNQATATFEAWIKIATGWSARAEGIVGCRNPSNHTVADKCLIIKADRKLYALAYDGGNKATSEPAGTIPLDTWTHIAFVANGSTLKTYQNGVEVGSVACGNTFAGFDPNNVFVGGDGTAGGVGFTFATFAIDEVATFASALTPTEILAHYERGATAPDPGTPESTTGGDEVLIPARAATVDQGSPEEIAQCVYAVLATAPGERAENPEFGLTPQLLRQGGVDLDELRRAIEEHEPRATPDVVTDDRLENMTQTVRVTL